MVPIELTTSCRSDVDSEETGVFSFVVEFAGGESMTSETGDIILNAIICVIKGCWLGGCSAGELVTALTCASEPAGRES